jgi:hypothetical protein
MTNSGFSQAMLMKGKICRCPVPPGKLIWLSSNRTLTLPQDFPCTQELLRRRGGDRLFWLVYYVDIGIGEWVIGALVAGEAEVGANFTD